MKKLLDFEIVIEPLSGSYRTSVIASPAGEAHGDFQLPFDDKDLQILLLNIAQSIGALRRNVRSLDSEETQLLADFGGKLFNAVFCGPVRECLGRSLSVAESKNARLRIRLRLPGALTNVPWEYLHDDHYGFIGLAPEAALVRYVAIPATVRPFPVTPPLRILAMISAPTDTRPLQADEEWDKLKDALSDLTHRRMVEVDRLEDGTLAALQARLRLREYHVLHFIGHGGYDDQAQDGALALEWPDRKKRLVTGRSLGLIIRGYKSLRLVVLNACEGARSSPADPYGGVAQALVRQAIPAVIAMQFEISDPAAVTFSKSFYKAIAGDLPVDVAVAEARSTMFAEGNEVEWATPVLYLRSPNGRIFTKSKTSPSDQEAREREAQQAADREAKEAADQEAREREAQQAADREAKEAADRGVGLVIRFTYVDFDLLIEPGARGDYRVRALRSPVGESAPAQIALPFSPMDLESFALRVGLGFPRLPDRYETALKDFGGKLYGAVFQGELRDMLQRSLRQTRAQGVGMRLRLRLADTPELAELPWEFLYDPQQQRFLGQSRHMQLVRYLDLPDPPGPSAVEGPLRLLVMISRPAGYPPLDGEQEWSLLTGALAQQQDEGRIIVERLAANMSTLRRRLRREAVHMLHFVGHGFDRTDSGDGVLVMEDRDGRPQEVTGEELGGLLSEYGQTGLVVLNPCEGARGSARDSLTGMAQSLVRHGLPAVVAMQFEITDTAAAIFAREFYGAITDGYRLEAALAEARGAIRDEGNVTEWGTPVLYSRAPDGRLFDVTWDAREAREAEIHRTPEDAARKAREAAILQADAEEFLATIGKVKAGLDSVGLAGPAGIELASPPRSGSADQDTEPSRPLQIGTRVSLGSIFGDVADQPGWTVDLVKSSVYVRTLAVHLHHETHTLEIRIRTFRDSILLDGKAVIKRSAIAGKSQAVSISDGHLMRTADVWVEANKAGHITHVKLTVDGQVLYQE